MTAIVSVLRLVNLRDVRQRPRRVLLSLLGIAGSVALILSMMVIHATLGQTIDRTSGLPAAAGLVVTADGAGPLSDAVAEAIRGVPEAGVVVPMIRQVSRIRGAGAGRRAVVLGLPPRGFRLLAAALPGARRLGGPTPGLTLSGPLAAALRVRPGAAVAFDTSRGLASARVARVLGRHTGTTFNGGIYALLPLVQTQRLFDRAGKVDLIYVYPRQRVPDAGLRRAVQKAVGAGVTVERPQEQRAAFRRTFEAIAGTLQVVQLIALLVGAFLVFNTVTMTVAERRPLVAVASLGGAAPGTIAWAMILETALIWAIGGALGVALGFVGARAGIGHVEATYSSVLPVTDVEDVALSAGEALTGVGVGVAVATAGAALASREILVARLVSGLRPATSYAIAGPRLSGSVRTTAGGAAAIACAMLLAGRASRGLAAGWTVVLLVLVLIGIGLALPVLVRVTSAVVRAAGLRRLGVAGRLAAAGLTRAPGRTALTVGALTAALGVMVAVGTATRSFEREAQHVVGNWNAAPLYVRAPGAGPLISDQPLRASLAVNLARVPGVGAAYPMRFALLGQRRHVAILAMPIVAAARAGAVLTRDVPLEETREIAALARGDVVVSRLLARRRGVGVGDRIRVPVAHGSGSFRIVGLFNDINSDDSLYMDLATFQRAMGDHLADRFAVFPAPGTEPGDVARRMRRAIAERHVGATVVAGRELTSFVVDTVSGLFSFAKLALLVASLVAGLTITNTMVTTTLERRRELAVQRMLGMRACGLAWSVLLEGAALATIAASIGIGVGVLLGFVVLELAEGQVAWRIGLHLDWHLLGMTAVAAPVLGAVAAGYPGWLATRPALLSLLKDG